MSSSRNPTARSPRTRPDRLAVALLLLALMAGLGLRAWLATRNAGLTMDSPLYVNMADSLAHGRPALGPAHHGYPVLVAGSFALIPDREWAGRAVSLLAGLLLLLVVYALARRGLAPRWATLAVWLLALHPLLAVFSGAVMTEASFMALTYLALWLLESGRLLAAGAGLGAAYVIRPETLVIAPIAALLSSAARRRALLVLVGFAAVAAPYLGYLRWERGAWTLTPKTALVRPMFESARAAEWRVRAAEGAATAEPQGLVERLRWAAPSMARRYLPNLGRHLGRLVEAWPPPLLLLSLVGLAAGVRALLAPLVLLAVLPFLSVPFDLRFSQLVLPALAVLAAQGAAWGAARLRPRFGRGAAAALAGTALLGIAWAWMGPPGRWALYFDEGPMDAMRAAGEWLRDNGRPGAVVMDRKAYVPFFARMRHVQLPDDDYETIVEFARESGVDYLVTEEFVVLALRPQLQPLVYDASFRQKEKRLRLLFATRPAPRSGVAVLEVLRDSAAAP